MSIFNFLKPKPKYTFTGALDDIRPKQEQEKDAKFEEIVAMATPVVWKEKAQKDWRTFPDLNQNNSLMCGAFSMKKLLGVLYFLKYGKFIEFSEEHIYQRRMNKPYGGMAIYDLYDIIGKGVTLKELTKVKINTDADADNCKIDSVAVDVGKIFAVGKPITLPNDIETIASTIQTTGKAIHIMTFFTAAEWSQLIPQIYDPALQRDDLRALRHFVTIVDFFKWNGVPYLLVEDSAWFGGITRRLLDARWILNRVVTTTYPMNFKFEESSVDANKPHYRFGNGVTLQFSPIVNYRVEVVELQDILKYEGLFPKNISSTGYYGALTAEAVLKFQKKYQVDTNAVLEQLAGKVVGPKTVDKLNSIYGS